MSRFDAEASQVFAGLSAEIRTQVTTLLRYGWPLEAERVLAQALGTGILAKGVVAYLVRRATVRGR